MAQSHSRSFHTPALRPRRNSACSRWTWAADGSGASRSTADLRGDRDDRRVRDDDRDVSECQIRDETDPGQQMAEFGFRRVTDRVSTAAGAQRVLRKDISPLHGGYKDLNNNSGGQAETQQAMLR